VEMWVFSVLQPSKGTPYIRVALVLGRCSSALSETKAEVCFDDGCGAMVVGAWFLALFHECIDEHESSVPDAACDATCPCLHGDSPGRAEGARRWHSVRHREAHLLLVADVIRTSRITRTGSICKFVLEGRRPFFCLRENAVHRCGAEKHSRSSGHVAAFLDGPMFWFFSGQTSVVPLEDFMLCWLGR
jgi:hypothetical protein